ncbi:hypothetical protein [Bacillus velezensis]|uniref:hypothetical protein n=1 Tax=Bacillus velezensis TaxID=492670 RepID=UPI0015E8CB70|nr:hypothetical protein [Bacillus velezensis]
MAKLDGVKTLDMVNGEITKVAYGGAAYERVEGEAKEFGSVGDLVLNGRIHCDLTVGAFYEIVINEEYGWTTVRDDVGDWHSDVLYNPRSVLFRKVAASANPSLEERVSSAEGEIESLKSDLSALKGAAEPKPERLKVGEYAKVVGNESGHYAEINEIVIVKRDDRDRMPFLCGKLNGNEAGIFYEDELVRATDEEVAEVKHAAKWAEIGREVGEYKRGDIARVVDNKCAERVANGDIIEVLKQASGGSVVDTVHGYFLKVELITPVEARFDR